MSAVLAALFTSAIELTGAQRSLMMLPLCLSVAIVYKTTRCENLRQVPLAAGLLWVTIVAGMCGVGVGLWALYQLLA